MHAGLMHRIVFVNFSECKQCRLLCWRTYQVFSKWHTFMKFLALHIMTYYTTTLSHLNYFKSFINLRKHLQNAPFVCLHIFLQFLFLFCPHTLRFWPTIHKRTMWSRLWIWWSLVSNPGLAIFFSLPKGGRN